MKDIPGGTNSFTAATFPVPKQMEDLCGEYQQAVQLCFNYEWIRKLGTVSASTPLLREHFYSSMYSNGSGGSGSCSSSSILGPWAETGSTSSSSSSLVSFKMMIPPVWSWWQTGWGSTLADLLQLFTVCLKYPCSKSTDQALFVYISLFTLCLCNSWGEKTELKSATVFMTDHKAGDTAQ